MKTAWAAVILLLATISSGSAASIIELWDKAEPPSQPKLKPVTVKAATTALLILDIQDSACTQDRRPRCVEAVPAMAKFLAKARSAKMPVVYSNAGSGTRETILREVKPNDDERIVKASVDKFYDTDLDKILKEKNVDTVIVCGTAAAGAVLFTATGAAVRGYKIVLPVDCVPAGTLYEEQAAVWTVINGPGTRRATTAATLETITIE